MKILSINADSLPRRQRSLWLGFVLALLMLQQWGLVHRYIHGAPGAVVAATAANAVGAQAPSWAQEANEVSGAFPAHDKPACLVFDQLCMGDAVPFAGLGLPLAVVAVLTFQHSTWAFIARWAALFQARGPPLLVL